MIPLKLDFEIYKNVSDLNPEIISKDIKDFDSKLLDYSWKEVKNKIDKRINDYKIY
jgi:hypothetical protein